MPATVDARPADDINVIDTSNDRCIEPRLDTLTRRLLLRASTTLHSAIVPN